MTDTPHPFDGLIETNRRDVYRDKRDSPMIFETGHPGPYDYTQGKTVKGRRGYSRVTSYIDVLDDKSNLEKYGARNVLAGLAAQPALLVDAANAIKAGDGNLDDPDVKDRLNIIVGLAKEAMYADRKADTGTAIHHWCETADLAIWRDGNTIAAALDALTDHDVNGHTFHIADYRADVAAYLTATRLLRPVAVEKLVVVDSIKVAGTPDRNVEWIGPDVDPPHGPPVIAGDVLIDDTKTGRIDYGLGKIAMQLGIYANAEYYDQETNTRTPLHPRLRRDWGIIIHVPAGAGTASLVWVDIAAGWDAVVNLAGPVRAWRNAAKKLSAPLPAAVTFAAAVTVDELRAAWRNDWADDVKAACLARVAELEAAA